MKTLRCVLNGEFCGYYLHGTTHTVLLDKCTLFISGRPMWRLLCQGIPVRLALCGKCRQPKQSHIKFDTELLEPATNDPAIPRRSASRQPLHQYSQIILRNVCQRVRQIQQWAENASPCGNTDKMSYRRAGASGNKLKMTLGLPVYVSLRLTIASKFLSTSNRSSLRCGYGKKEKERTRRRAEKLTMGQQRCGHELLRQLRRP